MSRLDDIEQLLSNPQQQSGESGMPVAADTECWRCGVTIDPKANELGACEACVTALRDQTELPVRTDEENADVLGDAIGEALAVMAPRVRAFVESIERMGLTITAHFGIPRPAPLMTPDAVIEVARLFAVHPLQIVSQPCVMHAEDYCSGEFVCEQCPYRFVLADADGNVVGFEGPPGPPRIDENCPHIDPDDGCCAHPDAMTPECWVARDGTTSDCPILDRQADMVDAMRMAYGHPSFPCTVTMIGDIDIPTEAFGGEVTPSIGPGPARLLRHDPDEGWVDCGTVEHIDLHVTITDEGGDG